MKSVDGESRHLFEAFQAGGVLRGRGPKFNVVIQAAGGQAGQVGVRLETIHLKKGGSEGGDVSLRGNRSRAEIQLAVLKHGVRSLCLPRRLGRPP